MLMTSRLGWIVRVAASTLTTVVILCPPILATPAGVAVVSACAAGILRISGISTGIPVATAAIATVALRVATPVECADLGCHFRFR